MWPVPPVVEQYVATLPDGQPDPAGGTDCGESCISSALAAVSGLRFSPGCLRQALTLPSDDGRTTALQLQTLWRVFGRRSRDTSQGEAALWQGLSRLRHSSRYCVMLGDWDAAGFPHWVLAVQRYGSSVDVMDPLHVAIRNLSRNTIRDLSLGEQLYLS